MEPVQQTLGNLFSTQSADTNSSEDSTSQEESPLTKDAGSPSLLDDKQYVRSEAEKTIELFSFFKATKGENNSAIEKETLRV